MRKMMIAAAAALVTVSTGAIAAIVATGPGTYFVGKGDVPSPFGWNNAQAQARQNAVVFSASESATYDITCEWTTVTGGKTPKTIVHDVEKKKTFSSNVAFDQLGRKTGQWTGWNLTLAGTTTTGGDLPQVGDACPQGGSASSSDPEENDAKVTAVSDAYNVSSGLYATWNGTTNLIGILPEFGAAL